MAVTHTTRFDIRDKVVINEDPSVTAVVQRIFISAGGTVYEVSWFDNSGAFKEHHIYEWQLTRKDDYV